jgi:hypothetical protein
MLGATASGAIELEPSIFGQLCEYADILHRCQLAIKQERASSEMRMRRGNCALQKSRAAYVHRKSSTSPLFDPIAPQMRRGVRLGSCGGGMAGRGKRAAGRQGTAIGVLIGRSERDPEGQEQEWSTRLVKAANIVAQQ